MCINCQLYVNQVSEGSQENQIFPSSSCLATFSISKLIVTFNRSNTYCQCTVWPILLKYSVRRTFHKKILKSFIQIVQKQLQKI